MREREYRIGPGAVSLLLVVVVASMSVLGLLALIHARGDCSLTERATALMESEYAVSAEAERKLAQLDATLAECALSAENDASYLQAVSAALPEGMELTERTVRWEEALENGRRLVCMVEILPLGETPACLRTGWYFAAGSHTTEKQ